MKRKISIQALEKLKQLEGCRLKAYKDEGGLLTIGYGHTSRAGVPMVNENSCITLEQAENILLSDLEQYEAAVNNNVKIYLNPAQFDALVLFCYNVGISAFCKSTLLRKINTQAFHDVPNEWLKWSHIKGNLSLGLLHRRSAELMLWNNQPSIIKPKRKLRHILPFIAPLGGICTAIADMIAQSTILQIALVIFMLPASFMGLFYYYKYNKRVLK